MFETLTHFGKPLTFSGIKMDYYKNENGLKIKHLTINGKAVNPFKYYSVAFTEGIVRGAEGINPDTIEILRNPKNTNFKIWATLEEKLSKGAPKLNLSNIDEDNHAMITIEK